MQNNETIEKELATASLKAAADLITGTAAGLTINAIRTRMERVAEDLVEAASDKAQGDTNTKKIIVDCCEHCCLKEPGYNKRFFACFKCTHAATYGRQIMDMNTIPDWCELEDE